MIANFFPNQSPEDLDLEMQLRRAAGSLPEGARLDMYRVLSSARPTFEPTTFVSLDGMVLARQKGRDIAFPSPVPLVKLSHIVFGYEELLQRKYCLPGFVEVEPGDIVVDCGAYVGGFTLSACKVASQVHAFEPDESNFRCLRRNVEGRDNVVLNLEGLYSQSKTMTLNISASSVEHSLLTPDDGPPIETRSIPVVALKDYCRRASLETIDFCKIEAEGVEPEVFDGLGDLRPRKIAIDVSPERNGESPAAELRARLAHLGYEVQQRGNVLFARFRSSQEAEARRRPPKIIYSVWLQGRKNAPDVVQFNFRRWEELNPSYELRVLDANDVKALLQHCPLATSTLSAQGLSDVVRIHLLKESGGIWVDASVLPVVPLDDWIPAATRAIEFFAFERPDVPLSSWFLCASPASPVTKCWWTEIERLWSIPRSVSTETSIPDQPALRVSPQRLAEGTQLPYFWIHCLFQYMLEHNPAVSDIWRRRHGLSSLACHELQDLFAKSDVPTDEEILGVLRRAPVQKLNWRKPYPVERLARLLNESTAPPSLGRRLAKLPRVLKAMLTGKCPTP